MRREILETKILNILNGLLVKYSKKPVENSKESLIVSGRLDSLLLVEFIFLLEGELGLKSQAHQFKKDKFETIELIANNLLSEYKHEI